MSTAKSSFSNIIRHCVHYLYRNYGEIRKSLAMKFKYKGQMMHRYVFIKFTSNYYKTKVEIIQKCFPLKTCIPNSRQGMKSHTLL